MPRRDQKPERRLELAPVLARTFAELGFRRTTTALLAERCGIQENILYRLWPDKRAMFIAALDHVYEASEATWTALLEDESGAKSAAERVLDYEAAHHGEHGLYRVLFAGLSESDDPEIAAALRGVYQRFHRLVRRLVVEHRAESGGEALDPTLVAWAFLGLGTMANIGNELELLAPRARRRLVGEIGQGLLGERG